MRNQNRYIHSSWGYWTCDCQAEQESKGGLCRYNQSMWKIFMRSMWTTGIHRLFYVHSYICTYTSTHMYISSPMYILTHTHTHPIHVHLLIWAYSHMYMYTTMYTYSPAGPSQLLREHLHEAMESCFFIEFTLILLLISILRHLSAGKNAQLKPLNELSMLWSVCKLFIFVALAVQTSDKGKHVHDA